MGSSDLRLEFLDPFHIWRIVEARHIKFGMQIGHWRPKNAKLGQKGS